LFDGKEPERRKVREAARDNRERNRRYHMEHREEINQKARLRREANPGMAAADSAYGRMKRKLLSEGVSVA
jgi:hypothetical protein